MSNIFYNSEALIVEYLDIIRAPGITALSILRNVADFRKDFDCTSIDSFDLHGLEEWYVKRNNINPFVSLGTKLPIELVNQMYYESLNDVNFVNSSKLLPAINIIRRAVADKLCKKVYFYIPSEINAILADILDIMLDDNFEVIIGDFNDGMKDIPADALYILADHKKVNMLRDIGRLDLSAIILANKYGYNIDENNKPIAPIEEYKNVFKSAYIDAYPLEFGY